MTQNVFSGDGAIQKFLNPDNHPPLPLVELPRHLNPHWEKGVRIFIKLMQFLPLANVKSLPAYHMLDEASHNGWLSGVHSLVESSSGNTVFSLAVFARAVFGIKKTLALASRQVEFSKLRLLQLFGVDVRVVEDDICPDPDDPESGVNQAKNIGGESGWLNPGQYHSNANPGAHERWTGPQIWEQTRGEVAIFAAGLGTGGTLVGTGRYLKRCKPEVQTVGVVREPNNPVPGVRTETLLRDIGFGWRYIADHLVRVGTQEAYQVSLDLCRSGLLVGPSGGGALAGLWAHLSHQTPADFDSMRNDDGQVVAVVVAPDSPLPYTEEYFRYLGEGTFPAIQNAHLLEQEDGFPEVDHAIFEQVSMDITNVYHLAYSGGKRGGDYGPVSVEGLWSRIQEGEDEHGMLREDACIVDLRSRRQFDDHHLPGSVHLEYGHVLESWDIFSSHFGRMEKTVIFVCTYGLKSVSVAHRLRQDKVMAYSLEGGTLEWSRREYPRIKPVNCPV